VVSRLVAWLLHLNGHHVGLACGGGLFLGTRRVEKRPSANWDAAHRLLMNRGVNAVVIENSPAAILRDGLSYDRCQVGVVTDMDGIAALAEFDVQDSDQLYKVLRTQIDVVLGDGASVLNAAVPRLVDMAELSDGEVVFYAEDGRLEALQHHRERGGRAVFLRGGAAVLAQGPAETPGANLEALLKRFGPASGVDAPTLLAAVAAAWAMNISPELIAAGLDTFVPELHLASA
jgi:cyanophycin synthetase